MLPVSAPAGTRIVSGIKRDFLRRRIERLFSLELFHLKLLIGTAVGVLATIVPAVAAWSSRFAIGTEALCAYTLSKSKG